MIRKLSEVFSWFRIFIWILVFIPPCLDISFRFTDVICWIGTDTFIAFTSRVQIFIFQTKETSDFLNGPFNCNIKFVVDKRSFYSVLITYAIWNFKVRNYQDFIQMYKDFRRAEMVKTYLRPCQTSMMGSYQTSGAFFTKVVIIF